jgi:hypothetical protein
MKTTACKLVWLVALAMAVLAGGTASAAPPRNERVAARIAERAYARQSIAEARAARAEIRAAEIAQLVPVPPPPRPATMRRMLRAGVPLDARSVSPRSTAGVAPPAPRSTAVVEPPRLKPSPPAVTAAPSPRPDAAARPAQPPVTSDPQVRPAAPEGDIADDGTRSVLATAEEPAAPSPAREPARPPVTHPPIELLPTP